MKVFIPTFKKVLEKINKNLKKFDKQFENS